jgi:hypothetical protein
MSQSQDNSLLYKYFAINFPQLKPQSTLDVNNLDTQTTMHEMIAHDKYQAFW